MAALTRRRRSVRAHFYSYLTVDAASPFVREDLDEAGRQPWLRRFNWQFTHRGLKPVRLRAGDEVPFNRLTSLPEAAPDSTPDLQATERRMLGAFETHRIQLEDDLADLRGVPADHTDLADHTGCHSALDGHSGAQGSR